MKVLIVTGGHFKSLELLKKYHSLADYVIAADSGLLPLSQANLKVDLIVGDFDSLKDPNWQKNYEGVPVITFPAEKDYTDTELAVLEALKLPSEAIYIIGGTGSRMDHSVANMMLLQGIGRRGRKAYLIDEHNSIEWIEAGRYLVPKEDYSFFSLVPLSESLCVSLIGFKYPLDRANVLQENTLTISNEWSESTGIVELHEGRALLIKAID